MPLGLTLSPKPRTPPVPPSQMRYSFNGVEPASFADSSITVFDISLEVLFSAILLGGTWAFTSQLIYISMGLSGLPVFAGFKSGPMVLAGPTAGYIIGFAIAAYFCGFLYQYLKDENRPSATSGIMAGFSSCITGILIIYLFGFVHLFGFFLSLFPGQPVKDIISMTWKSGIEPFIMIDFIKVLIIVNVLELGKKRK